VLDHQTCLGNLCFSQSKFLNRLSRLRLTFLFLFKAALCNRALGMRSGVIKNAQITASSAYNKFHAASLGRLGRTKRGRYIGAWCARHNNHNQWFKVDFGLPMKITKIDTQGRQDYGQWVTRYLLSSSQDGIHWSMYRYKSNDKVACYGGLSSFTRYSSRSTEKNPELLKT